MRRALNIALVVTGILVTAIASRSKTVTETEVTTSNAQNSMTIHGLHVALPAYMKKFPAERVSLP